MGATRWEVIRSHVLPYAAPGILTGVVLTLARAFGETAPLLLVGASRGSSPRAASFGDCSGQLHGAARAHLQLDRPPQKDFQALRGGGDRRDDGPSSS